MKDSLKLKNSYRHIFSVALPMSLAIMIPQLSILANTIFLGNYESSNGIVLGKDALAVAGVAGIYHLVYAMVTFGLASGILMLMSRKAGEEDPKGVGFVFRAGFQLGVALTVILMVISFFFSDAFFDFSLKNDLISSLAKDFMAIRIWGLPFLFCAHLGNVLFIATDKTKYMLFGTLGQTIINVGLDYLFIFGKGPFPEMGIEGAALASTIAELVSFLIVFGIIFYSSAFKQFKISLFKKVEVVFLKEYFIKSSPLMLQYLVSIGAWEVFFIYIEHLGERALGASQIIRSVYGVMGIIVWALANTVTSMVSNLYGQKAYNQIIPLTKKVLAISFTYVAIVSSVLFLFRKQFLGIYTDDIIVIQLAEPALGIVLSAALIFSFSTIYFNAMLGLGNTQRNLIYESITIFGYLIFCYIVVEKMRSPLWVAWTSEYVYWSLMLLLSGVYIHSKKWIPKA